MSQDAENLLEHDRIEEVLEAADPPQPVVMIEYSHKGLTWYLLLALIAIVTIGGLWLYHKKQLEDVETQARYARRELDRLKAQSLNEPLPGELGLATRKTPTPPASPAQTDNSSPSQTASTPAVAPTLPDLPPVVTTANVVSPKDRDLSQPAPNSQSAQTTPPQTALPAAVAALTNTLEPSQSSVGALIGGTPGIAPSPVASTQPPAEATPSASSSSPATVNDPIAAPESVADASGPAEAVPAVAPLPSKEETIRQIEEEAAQKATELQQQTVDQQVEIRRLRNEERVRFHEELRAALKEHGLRAGPAIDRLCDRFGYDTDIIRFGKAARVWAMTDKSLAYRVGRIRTLDLPETVILNFLSDDLHARLRTPGGPRDKNEVRVRAAKKLLTCDPQANDQAAAMRTTARGNGDESPSPRKARTP